MKKSTLILILLPLLSLGVLFWYLSNANQTPDKINNTSRHPLEYKDNTLQCPQCNMFIVGKNDTAQIITNDGKTHFFDDVGCAILWIREKKLSMQSLTFWVHTRDTHTFIEASKAFYSVTDNTPMKYGFGAYETKQPTSISFEEMQLRMLRGENMSDPRVRKKLLGN
ncbi:MAG: hypothetical protein KBE02_02360 [Sulfurospirillum sp.]|nr:hypothetical protein [Sulfurospirillum sp.]